MIYTVIRVNSKIEVHNATERQLRQTLGCPFEVLEIHKQEDIANERANILRKTTYKKRRKSQRGFNRMSRLAKKKQSERMKGPNNPRYKKKHSPEALKRISQAKLGNRHAVGRTITEKSLERYKKKRAKWTPIPKGSMWFHHPETGEERRSMTPIEGWIRGRSDEYKEAGKYYLSLARKAKYKNKRNKSDQ
jgi:hypothetical protein